MQPTKPNRKTYPRADGAPPGLPFDMHFLHAYRFSTDALRKDGRPYISYFKGYRNSREAALDFASWQSKLGEDVHGLLLRVVHVDDDADGEEFEVSPPEFYRLKRGEWQAVKVKRAP